jgi:hypothetical protein
MQIERDFVERRGEERRKLIATGIRALHDRRAAQRRQDNAAISRWIDKFEKSRRG